MTAAGVPDSFFPDIVYDQDGKPRPARLYDVANSDDPPVAPDVKDVTDHDPLLDPLYRPLG